VRIPGRQLWYGLSAPLISRFHGPVRYLRAKEERVKDRLLEIPVFVLAMRTIRELSDDDATHMAAGVAYYAILSLFPMTLGLIAVLSFVLESGDVKVQLLAFFQTYLPGSTGALEANIQAVGKIRGVLGFLSIVGLFWTASTVFGAISRAVNRAWDLHRDPPFYLAKLRHIGMAFSVGLLFLMSLATTAAVQVLGAVDLPEVGQLGFLESDAISILTRPLPFLFTLSIFLLIYKFVPNTPTRWRYIWPGALLAAIAFEVSKSVFVFYLENFAAYEKVYGSLGSVIALLVWTYLSAFILIVGAEIASEYGRMLEQVEQGRLIADRDRPAEDVEEEDELW
jgi:membrane protein